MRKLIFIQLFMVSMLFYGFSNIVNADVIQNSDISNNYIQDHMILDVEFGYSHGTLLKEDGSIYAWGQNTYGQLANDTGEDSYLPFEITEVFPLDSDDKINFIESGYIRSFAISENGRVFAWGKNSFGQLGDGTYEERHNPVEITGQFNLNVDEKIVSISIGGNASVALTSEHRVFTWGAEWYEQLGYDTTSNSPIPTDITDNFSLNSGDYIIDVKGANAHMLALTNEGIVYQWGDIYDPTSSDTTYLSRYETATPEVISSYISYEQGEKVVQIATGNYFSIFVTNYGKAYSWGHNSNGQLGLGDATQRNVPTLINSNTFLLNDEEIVSVFAGAANGGFVTDQNRVFTYGSQVGSDHSNQLSPKLVTDIDFSEAQGDIKIDFSDNNSGYLVSMIYFDHKAFIVGTNSEENLLTGDDVHSFEDTYREVTWLFGSFNIENYFYGNIIEIEGFSHVLLLTDEDRLYTWGQNRFGQLGTGDTMDRFTPIDITDNIPYDSDVDNMKMVMSHSDMSAVLTESGRLFTWGYGYYAHIGNGSTVDSYVPVEITDEFILDTNDKIDKVFGNDYVMFAVSESGRIFSWGYNISLTLGNDTYQYRKRLEPVDITSNFNQQVSINVKDMAFSNNHVMLLTDEGTLFTWGQNDYGQMGNGESPDSAFPVDITNRFDLLPGEKIEQISSGYWHSYIVTNLSRVYTFGYNLKGESTQNPTEVSENYDPIEITGNFNLQQGETVVSIQAHSFSGVLTTSNHRVLTWGNNASGQLGNGNNDNFYIPQDITPNVTDMIGIKLIKAFYGNIFLVDQDDNIHIWGYGQNGMFGNGNLVNSNLPEIVHELNPDIGIYDYDTPNEINENSSIIRAKIYPSHNLEGIIDSVTIGGNEYTTDSFNIISGRIEIEIPVNGVQGEQINLDIESITLTNGDVKVLTGDTEQTATFIADVIAPKITFDYDYNIISEIGVDGTAFLSATSVDDTEDEFSVSITGTVDWDTVGDYTLTYQATDLSGNTSQVERIITVMDAVNLDGSTVDGRTYYYVEDQDVNAASEVGRPIIRYNSVNYYPNEDFSLFSYVPGANEINVSYIIDDELIILNMVVHFTDIEPPSFEVSGPGAIEAGVSDINWTEYIVNALDNSNGELTYSEIEDNIIYDTVGIYSVIVQVSDASSNSTDIQIEVEVVDTTPPTFDFIEDQIVEVYSSEVDWTSLILNAQDNSSDLLNYFILEDNVDYGVPGDYTITVGVQENRNWTTSLIKDGSFSNPDGIWVLWYADWISSNMATVSFVDQKATVTINNLGETFWNIQLYQEGIELEAETTYTISFDAKSTSTREITIDMNRVDIGPIQHTAYISTEWETYTLEFYNDAGAVSANLIFHLGFPGELGDIEIDNVRVSGETSINPAYQTFEVSVVDTTKPVISLVGDSTINVEYSDGYIDDGATAIDNYDENINVIISGEVDTSVLGTYYITYSAVDSSGNIADEVVRTVIVEDTTKPELTLFGEEEIVVEINTPYVEEGVNFVDNYDIDGDIVITGEVDTDTVGTYVLEYYAIDSSGNQSETIQRTVIVREFVPPTFDEIPDQTIESGSDDIDWTSMIVNIEDNMSLSFEKVEVEDNVDYDTPGDYFVTVKVIDESLNETAKEFKVLVVDTTAPTFDTNIKAEYEAGSLNENWEVLITNYIDNSDLDMIGVSVEHNIVFDVVGTYSVKVTVTDGSNNDAVREFSVEIIDTISPVFNLIGEETVYIEIDGSYEELGAIYTDNAVFDNEIVIDASAVDTSVLGEYKVIYSVTDDGGNTGFIERTVIVGDTIAPVITLIGDQTIIVEYEGTYEEQGVNIFDNYEIIGSAIIGGDIVDTNKLGTYVITYNYTDPSGNVAIEINRIVEVVDTTIPSITLQGEGIVYVEFGSEYIEEGAMFSDNYDDTGTINIYNEVDNSEIGEYTVTYETTDSNGNVAISVVRTVIVQDTIPPVVELKLSVDTIYIGDEYINPGVTATDLSELSLEVDNPVDTSQAGVYIIQYTVLDEGLNEVVVSRYVTVLNNKPEFELNDTLTTIKAGEAFVDEGCSVEYNNTIESCIVKENNVNTSVVGVYTVVYSFTVNDIEYTTTRYVFVYDDNNLPVIAYRKEEEVVVI